MLKTIQNTISNPFEFGLGFLGASTGIVGPVIDKAAKKANLNAINSFYDLVLIPIPSYPITALHVTFVMGCIILAIQIMRLNTKRRSEDLDLLMKEKKFNKKR